MGRIIRFSLVLALVGSPALAQTGTAVPQTPPVTGGPVKIEPLAVKKLRAKCAVTANRSLPDCIALLGQPNGR